MPFEELSVSSPSSSSSSSSTTNQKPSDFSTIPPDKLGSSSKPSSPSSSSSSSSSSPVHTQLEYGIEIILSNLFSFFMCSTTNFSSSFLIGQKLRSLLLSSNSSSSLSSSSHFHASSSSSSSLFLTTSSSSSSSRVLKNVTMLFFFAFLFFSNTTLTTAESVPFSPPSSPLQPSLSSPSSSPPDQFEPTYYIMKKYPQEEEEEKEEDDDYEDYFHNSFKEAFISNWQADTHMYADIQAYKHSRTQTYTSTAPPRQTPATTQNGRERRMSVMRVRLVNFMVNYAMTLGEFLSMMTHVIQEVDQRKKMVMGDNMELLSTWLGQVADQVEEKKIKIDDEVMFIKTLTSLMGEYFNKEYHNTDPRTNTLERKLNEIYQGISAPPALHHTTTPPTLHHTTTPFALHHTTTPPSLHHTSQPTHHHTTSTPPTHYHTPIEDAIMLARKLILKSHLNLNDCVTKCLMTEDFRYAQSIAYVAEEDEVLKNFKRKWDCRSESCEEREQEIQRFYGNEQVVFRNFTFATTYSPQQCYNTNRRISSIFNSTYVGTNINNTTRTATSINGTTQYNTGNITTTIHNNTRSPVNNDSQYNTPSNNTKSTNTTKTTTTTFPTSFPTSGNCRPTLKLTPLSNYKPFFSSDRDHHYYGGYYKSRDVLLHRCQHSYGCCRSDEEEDEDGDLISYDRPQTAATKDIRVCTVDRWERIYRYVDYVMKSHRSYGRVRTVSHLYRFLNHTSCRCQILVRNNKRCPSMFQFPPQSPLTHVVTQHPSELFLSSNHIYNTDPPSISTTPSIPLPHPPIQPPFCLCVPNTITYQRCLKVMEGRAILNLADVRCIQLGECHPPTCDEGLYFRLDRCS